MKVELLKYDKAERNYLDNLMKILFRGLRLSKFRVFDWGKHYEITLQYKKRK